MVILPDVRGLHPFYEELALRFAEHGVDAIAIDWFGRTAGVGRRGEDFEHMPHVERTTWDGNATDIAAGVQALRDDGVASVFTIGFCMGGRMSFLAATLDLDLAGVIGLYGTLRGPWRNDAPAPLDRLDDVGSPVLGLFGGADGSITADAVEAFDARADRPRGRSSGRHLPRGAAQLLRPQGGRFRQGERGRVGRGPGLHRRSLERLSAERRQD